MGSKNHLIMFQIKKIVGQNFRIKKYRGKLIFIENKKKKMLQIPYLRDSSLEKREKIIFYYKGGI